MGKNKRNRQRKKIIFIAREGIREEKFLCYLQELFDPERTITLKFPPEYGGNSNKILDRAIKSFYSINYAWFDEDNALDEEHRESLKSLWGIDEIPENLKDSELQTLNVKNKNPIIIVSHPLSVEGILIRLFDKNMPKLEIPIDSPENFEKNKNRMKSAVDGFIKNGDIEFYRQNLSKSLILEKAAVIDELKLLLTIFDKDI
ncbi:hypothetical protein IJ732_05405 [bacterium]|nr:hypothetical protein [bacterium]